mmetsp:Transcript_15825/g.43005  ORF Transcript_15825/g.43005 Transcript_15825/m.43005 type:complete len:200 (+) Transcript_15825:580-1179(+)
MSSSASRRCLCPLSPPTFNVQWKRGSPTAGVGPQGCRTSTLAGRSCKRSSRKLARTEKITPLGHKPPRTTSHACLPCLQSWKSQASQLPPLPSGLATFLEATQRATSKWTCATQQALCGTRGRASTTSCCPSRRCPLLGLKQAHAWRSASSSTATSSWLDGCPSRGVSTCACASARRFLTKGQLASRGQGSLGSHRPKG